MSPSSSQLLCPLQFLSQPSFSASSAARVKVRESSSELITCGDCQRDGYITASCGFKIPKFKKLTKDEPDDTLSVAYFDAARGIEYSVHEGKLHAIEYGPSVEADAALRCAPDPEADGRETRVRQMCRQLFGSVIDQRMGLYAVNPFHVVSLTFDRHGDLIAVDVEPKYFYDWIHIDWEGRGEFPHLSKSEHERLLAQIDQIKPREPLLQSVTTNSQTPRVFYRRELYLKPLVVARP